MLAKSGFSITLFGSSGSIPMRSVLIFPIELKLDHNTRSFTSCLLLPVNDRLLHLGVEVRGLAHDLLVHLEHVVHRRLKV